MYHRGIKDSIKKDLTKDTEINSQLYAVLKKSLLYFRGSFFQLFNDRVNQSRNTKLCTYTSEKKTRYIHKKKNNDHQFNDLKSN